MMTRPAALLPSSLVTLPLHRHTPDRAVPRVPRLSPNLPRPARSHFLGAARCSSQDSIDAVDEEFPAAVFDATPAEDVQRRSEPPYRVVAGLAALGAFETAYLTVLKLTGGDPVACSASGYGCSAILSSNYAELLGIPLPALGFLAYGSVFAAASQGAFRVDDSKADDFRLYLLGSASVIASTSAYLMYTLFTKLGGQPCVYCFTSAALSTTILGCSFKGSKLPDVAGGGVVALGVLSLLAVGFGDVALPGQEQDAPSQKIELPYREATGLPRSEARYVKLAKYLNASGAKFYGAFWCSHCQDQKYTFGAEAVQELPYVECFPDGFYSDPDTGSRTQMAQVCKDADLEGFPTWLINGVKTSGEKTYDELAAASGYQEG